MVKRPSSARRGSMYIAVLGVSVIVTAMALGALLAVRVQGAAEASLADTVQARLNAESGINSLAHTLSADASWRSRPQGAWTTDSGLDKGSFTLWVTDPIDGSFSNRPYDPVLIRARGVQRNSSHILEVQLQPTGVPITALTAAIAAAGEFRVDSGRTLNANGAKVSTNTSLRNDGAINGSADCNLSIGLGPVSGGVAILSPAKSMPAASVQAMYTALAASVSGGSTITNKVLGPGVNTVGGAVSTDGIYLISSGSDITITGCRFYGTVIIDAPGRTVTINGPVSIEPARPDYPSLIVNANLVLSANSASPLSESARGVSFNPTGMVGAGATNDTTSDSYPCEIRGLIHCRGEVTLDNNTLIRGALIAQATGSNSIRCGDAQVVWDPGLLSTPPMGYTTSELLRINPGTWRQVVLP